VPKAAHIAVDELRAVVELEPGALVAALLGADAAMSERAGHTQMDDQRELALQAKEQVLAAAIERRDPFSLELGRQLVGGSRPRQALVDDLGADDRSCL